jgi:MFS family permease
VFVRFYGVLMTRAGDIAADVEVVASTAAGPARAEAASGDAPRLWRNRDFMFLWTGETISALGSSMSSFVYPIVGYSLTGSATEAALAGTSYLLGGVTTRLPAGALVDRWNRKVTMALSAAAGMLLYGTLAAAMVLGRLTLTHLLVTAFLTGVARAFFEPAEAAAVRRVVPAGQLPAALSQNEARQHAARLVGPPAGGLLYAVARWLPFLADAVSYAATLVAVLLLRSPLRAPEGRPGPATIRRDVAEGLRFLLSRSFFRAVAISATLINFAVTALFLVLTLKLLRAGVHPAAIGSIETIGAVAGIAGAVLAPALVRRVPTGRLVVAGCVPMLVGLAPMAFTDDVLLIGGLLAVALLCLPAINAAIYAYLLAITPDRLQGRVNAGLMFSSTAAQPAGPMVGGFLLALFGGLPAMLLVTAVMAVGVLALALNPEVRRLPSPAQWDTAAPARPQATERM